MKRCPKCSQKSPYKLSDGRYKCKECGHRYAFISIWNSIRLPEATKKRLLEMFVLGVPVYRQRFRRTVSLATIQRFYRIVRGCCALQEELREPFEGSLECDETMFGGARKGKRGWGAAGKIIVFGILKRNGMVKVFPVQGRGNQELIGLVQTHTKPGSLYYTDDWHAYASLRVRGKHIVVRKELGQPKGREHINGIEGFWSFAKHWLYPYRGVPKKFFHLYLAEICLRFNHRNEDIFPLLYKLMNTAPVKDLRDILVRIR